jgi:energy-coupling factor transporter ATP-binding protein EcfA2
MKLAKMDGHLPIILGGTKDSSLLTIDASAVDGTLNIITGKKGCGKSHLSKLLMTNLVGYKATVVIFDLNGEYSKLGLTNDGKRNMYYDKIHTLAPSQNFKVALEQLGLNTVMGILVNALHLPGTSAREFRRLWKSLKERGKLTMQDLGDAIRDLNCNQHVKDALTSRFHSFASSGFFTDCPAKQPCWMIAC